MTLVTPEPKGGIRKLFDRMSALAKVVGLLRLTYKRSPLTTTVAKSAVVRRKLFVNGAEIPI
jgi:hypothetical protein